MCHRKILSFDQCRHRAQMLSLCGRTGYYSPVPCSSCVGHFTQHDSVCRGCHEVLKILGPELKVEELPDVKGVTRDMPFSYVVYGQLPWSQWDGAQRAALEHTLVRMPGCRSDPLEDLMLMMSIKDDGPGQAIPSSKKQSSSSPKKKPISSISKKTTSFPPAQAQRADSQSKKKPPDDSSSRPRREKPDTSPGGPKLSSPRPINKSSLHASQPKQTHPQADPKPHSKPSSRPSSWPFQVPQSSSAQFNDKQSSTSRDSKPATSLSKRPTGRSKPRKHVWFAPTAEVQYFEKHLAPRAVKRKWRGPDRDFAMEVIA